MWLSAYIYLINHKSSLNLNWISTILNDVLTKFYLKNKIYSGALIMIKIYICLSSSGHLFEKQWVVIAIKFYNIWHRRILKRRWNFISKNIDGLLLLHILSIFNFQHVNGKTPPLIYLLSKLSTWELYAFCLGHRHFVWRLLQ